MEETIQYPGVNLEFASTPERNKGNYSNAVGITPQEGEMTLDFLHIPPPVKGKTTGELKARIIMTVLHAKRLTLELNNWLEHYEATFGVIPLRLSNPLQPYIPK